MLPMGLVIASDIFQAKMGTLFAYMENILVYIDDTLMIGTNTFEEHIKMVHKVLKMLEDHGMQVNPLKSFWGRSEVEYLGFLVTREVIRPQKKKFKG